MSRSTGRSAAAQPSRGALRLDQHEEILVAVGERVVAEVDGAAVGEGELRQVGEARRHLEPRAAALGVGLLRQRRDVGIGLRRERQPPLAAEAGHAVARRRDRAMAAIEGVALVGEGVAAAERDLLGEARAHDRPGQHVARGRAVAAVPRRRARPSAHWPASRAPGPASTSLVAKGAQKKSPDRYFRFGGISGSSITALSFDPRRGVERRQLPPADLDLEGADMADVEVERQAHARRGDGVEFLGHVILP